MTAFPHRRIVVVGTTGSGKSTLAQRLAETLGLDYIELDALHWDPGWVAAPPAVFRARADSATRSPGWAVAGNYHLVRDIIWPRAQAVVWLDYPLPVIFGRLWRRTWRRWWTREVLWNGNVEALWPHLKLWSDDSLFHWLFKTYWRRKREYPQLFALPEHSHLEVIRLATPRQAEDWLASLSAANRPMQTDV